MSLRPSEHDTYISMNAGYRPGSLAAALFGFRVRIQAGFPPNPNDPRKLGCDLSEHNGANIQFDVMAAYDAPPVEFMWIRTGGGDSHTDIQFVFNWEATRANGQRRAPYFYLRGDRSAEAQFEHFVWIMETYARDESGDVDWGEGPILLDVERTQDGASKAQMSQLTIDWIRLVEAYTGRLVIIYTGKWYTDGFMEPQPWWSERYWVLAHWYSNSEHPGPATPPQGVPQAMVICQQTTSSSDGSFLGTVGRLDLMRWERADLFDEMWNAPAPTPPPSGDHDHKDLEAGIAANTETNKAQTLGIQLIGSRIDYLEARVKALEEDAPPPEPEPDRLKLRWPAQPPKVVTQWYGINPQWYNSFGLPGHEGLDFRALNGSEVLAMVAGTVYRVQKFDSGPYGIHVRIEHRIGDKVFKTAYAHFMDALVSVGDQVAAGQAIGRANNTGNSYGAHLHVTLKEDGANLKSWMSYMAKNPTTGAAKPNDIINPVPYMPDLFPGLGWRVDTNGNLRTEPRKTAVNLIRLLRGGEIVQATGEIDYDWWQVIAANDVVGWFWNPGYKLSAI